jgi:hypothetical protein
MSLLSLNYIKIKTKGNRRKISHETKDMIAGTMQTHLSPNMPTVNKICVTITQESLR